MLWRQFFARVNLKHKSIYFRILAKVSAVAMATELVKNKAYEMVFVYLKKNPVVRLFSSFAHYELTLNLFCQHCSNKIWTFSMLKFRFFVIDHSRGL